MLHLYLTYILKGEYEIIPKTLELS